MLKIIQQENSQNLEEEMNPIKGKQRKMYE